MYLSGGNATASASLPPAGNYLILPGRFGSPGYTRRNPAERAEIKSYYVIMRETLVHKSIYNHLTRLTTVDKIINTNALKAPWKAKSQR